MTNLQVGDTIAICGKEYILEHRFLGGFQFRTWLVTHDGKRYVAKLTDKIDRFLRELRAYVHLKTKGYPDRYYAELVAIDYEARYVKKKSSQTGNFNAILLKYYKYNDLKKFVERATEAEKRLIIRKLKRRVERLHQAGLCHGDLNEKNIMITDKKKGIGVRLIDFGASSFASDEALRKDNRKLNNIMTKLG